MGRNSWRKGCGFFQKGRTPRRKTFTSRRQGRTPNGTTFAPRQKGGTSREKTPAPSRRRFASWDKNSASRRWRFTPCGTFNAPFEKGRFFLGEKRTFPRSTAYFHRFGLSFAFASKPRNKIINIQ
jgi:hypothetical protein